MKNLIAFLVSLLLIAPAFGFGGLGVSGGGRQQNLNFSMFDFAGDSRTTNITSGGVIYQPGSGFGTTANSWFVQADALNGDRYMLGIQNGGSACRSDQFLAPAVLAPMLASPAGWLVIGPYGVNDLAPLGGTGSQVSAACPGNSGTTFPYTNSNGVSVTQTTAGSIIAGNVINAAKAAVAVGKNVVLIAEYGATNTTQASLGQMYDANARLKAFAQMNPGRVYYIDFGPVIYNPTSSASAVAFKTGYFLDGTHAGPLGAIAMAPVFNAAIGPLVPYSDNLISNINNVNATSSRQLISNPLFSTLTGGSTSGCNAGSTGNVPSGWAISCTTTNITYALTSGAETNGFGNAITLALTCSGSGVLTFSSAPSNSLWNLTDILQLRANVAVASGSSNFAVYGSVDINSDQGTFNHWGIQNGSAAYGPGPTTAYNYTLSTVPGGPLANSTTKGFTVGKILLYCSAAGNGTATVSRASFERAYLYSNGSFTGQ